MLSLFFAFRTQNAVLEESTDPGDGVAHSGHSHAAGTRRAAAASNGASGESSFRRASRRSAVTCTGQ